LGGCVRADEPTRRRVGCALSGYEDEPVELHARRIRTDRRGEAGCADGMMGHGDLRSSRGEQVERYAECLSSL
jgi:hypothetical protein